MLGDTISNTLYNSITEAIVPDEFTLDEILNDIQYIAKNSLGFLYDPFVFIEFLFQEIGNLSNDEIIFHSPSISIMDFQILPEMEFDFNKQLFNTTDEWHFVRKVQLTVCNFVLVCWFINYFISAFNRIFGVKFEHLDVDE